MIGAPISASMGPPKAVPRNRQTNPRNVWEITSRRKGSAPVEKFSAGRSAVSQNHKFISENNG